MVLYGLDATIDNVNGFSTGMTFRATVRTARLC